MASIGRLLSSGSMVPLPGGGWKLELSSKFKWDDKKLQRVYGRARMDALKKAGLVVKDQTRRKISSRSPRKNPQNVPIAERHGFKLVAQVYRVPKADVMTSWKTTRFPKGFLRGDIQSDFDPRTKTAVCGPAKLPRMNKLLESGGQTTRYFVPTRVRGRTVYGTLANVRPRVAGTRTYQSGFYSFQTTIRGRRFMEKGLQASLRKIPEQFRNQLRGP